MERFYLFCFDFVFDGELSFHLHFSLTHARCLKDFTVATKNSLTALRTNNKKFSLTWLNLKGTDWKFRRNTAKFEQT